MKSSTKVWVVRFSFFIVHIIGISAVCRFPETLYATKGPWRIYSEDGTTNNNMYVRREVSLSGPDLKVVHQGGRTKLYKCQTAVGDDMTYTISVHEADKETLHTCVQFIIRATNVIQWKMAPVTTLKVSADRLCFRGPGAEERLKLMDSPFVYNADGMWAERRNRFQPYLSCPLDGGYVVTGWRDETGKEHCDASVFPMMKLENECEKGEGLKFSFIKRKSSAEKKCPIPDDDNRRYYCRGHWTDGAWTFMVFVDYLDSILYTLMCMRYPTNKGDAFTLDIFRDSVCDTTENFENSQSRFHVDLIKYPIPSLCDNMYPTCDRIKDAKSCHAYKVVESCPDTCKACENSGNIFEEKPEVLPPTFLGEWLKDTNAHGQETVMIEPKSITIPSLGKYKLVGDVCLGAQSIGTTVGTEYMFIQTFDNGCSPRATKIVIANLSASVIGLYINDPVVADIDVKPRYTDRDDRKDFLWELRDNPDIWCIRDGYSLPFNQQIESFRTPRFSWFSLVNTKPNSKTVKCRVPSYIFTITTHNGTRCRAGLKQSSYDGFQVTFTKCDNNTQTQIVSPDPMNFKCLLDHRGSALRRFLITESSQVLNTVIQEKYICWVFSALYANKIYLMRASECDSKSDDFVRNGVRKELALIEYEVKTSTGAQYQLKMILYGISFMLLVM